MSSPIALETGLATPADYDSLESLYLDVIAAVLDYPDDPKVADFVMFEYAL